MKKVILTVLFSLLLLCMSNVFASDAQPTVNVAVNGNSITVSGDFAGQSKKVTLLVKDSKGNTEYVGQGVSNPHGLYQFTFSVNNSVTGVYTVYIGGEGIATLANKSFTVTSGGNSSGIVVPINTPKPEKVIVNEDSLKSGKDGKVSIDLPNDKNEVLLPGNAASIVGNNIIEIKMNGVTAYISSEVLKNITSAINETELKDMQISFKAKAIEEKDKTEIANKASVSESAGIKVAGDVFEFKLSVIGKDNKETEVKVFEKPISVVFKVQNSADKKLMGIYYIGNDGTLEYIGGELSKDGSEMSANIYHFSKYAVLEFDKSFDDVPSGYWAYQTIKELTAKHIINGINESEFAPEGNLTRAEFTKLIVTTLGLRSSKNAAFEDVDSGEWYSSYINAAFEAGIIKGRSDKTFAPNEYMTREEIASLLVRAYLYKTGSDLKAENESGFSDYSDISDWAKTYVDMALEKGLLKGYTDGSFKPLDLITRSEGAQAIYNFLK